MEVTPSYGFQLVHHHHDDAYLYEDILIAIHCPRDAISYLEHHDIMYIHFHFETIRENDYRNASSTYILYHFLINGKEDNEINKKVYDKDEARKIAIILKQIEKHEKTIQTIKVTIDKIENNIKRNATELSYHLV